MFRTKGVADIFLCSSAHQSMRINQSIYQNLYIALQKISYSRAHVLERYLRWHLGKGWAIVYTISNLQTEIICWGGYLETLFT